MGDFLYSYFVCMCEVLEITGDDSNEKGTRTVFTSTIVIR